MAILSRVVGDHLSRVDPWFDRSLSWTRAFWVFCPYNPVGIGAGFFTNYEDFDDLPHTHMIGSYNYLDAAFDPINPVCDLELYLHAGLDFIDYSEVSQNFRGDGQVDGDWHFVCQTYDQNTHDWQTYFDLRPGHGMTQDMSAIVPPYNNPQEWLNGTGGPNAGQGYAYYRVWQAKLTITEMALEMVNRRAFRVANLLADTPLESIADVTDKSGNGRNWGLSGSWVNCVDPLMPVAEPQYINSNDATGTVSVTLTKPTNTADGDTMFISLIHRGGGFATMPAGWTPISQLNIGTIRLELHYRRANAEGASYNVTGLADSACGIIQTFRNVAVDLIDQIGTVGYTNIPTNSTTSFAVADAQVRVPGALFMTVGGMGLNRFFNSLVGGDTTVNDPPIPWSLGALTSAINNASGSGSALCVLFGQKQFAGHINPVTPFAWNTASGSPTTIPDAISLTVSLLPQSGAVIANPTRWYLTGLAPNDVMTRGACQGNWNLGLSDRDNRAYYGDKSLLTPTASFNGGVGQNFAPIVTGAGATPYYGLGTKFISERLRAGTSSGTFSITLPIRKSSTFSVTAKLRVHVYVCRGNDLTNVVGTLLANYTDTLSLPTTDNWVRLATPQNLAVVTWQDGDRVVVEVGVEATANVGTQATAAFMRNGCASPGGTPFDDGPSSGAYSGNNQKACYVDFSAGLPILPYRPPSLFTHYQRANAQLVPALPFNTGFLDTRRVPAPKRGLWYTWTAPFSGRINFDVLGTIGGCAIDVYIGSSTTTISFTTTGGVWGTGPYAQLAQNTGYLVVTAGTQYTFRISPGEAGGCTRFRLGKNETPQDDDLYVSCQHNIGYRWNGSTLVPIVINSDFFNDTPTGVLVDTSRRPMYTTNFSTDPLHTGDRLIFATFADGVVEVLDLLSMNAGPEDEVNFYNGDVLGFAQDFMASIVIARDGTIYLGWFGDGYTVIGSPSTIGTYDIRFWPLLNVELQPGTASPAGTIRPAPDREGSDYIDLDSSNTVLFYTSAGQKVKRITTAGVQLADFATVPIAPGPRPYLRGVRLLPPGNGSGGLLVANGSRVERLDANGTVIQSYTPVTNPPGASYDLDKCELTKDATKFWVSDQYSTMLFLFDLETGEQLAAVENFMPHGQFSGFDVYNGYRAGLAPNCPAITITAADAAAPPIPFVPPTVVPCSDGAVEAPTAADGLTRSGAYLNIGQNWTMAGWFSTAAIPDGDGNTLWIYGLLPSGPGLPQIYMYTFNDASGSGVFSFNFGAQTFGPSVDIAFGAYPVEPRVPFHAAVVYDSTLKTLDVFFDGLHLEQLSIDLGAVPFTTTEYLLHDQVGIIVGGAAGSQVRTWQRKLSSGEILDELASETAVHTDALLTDTPLTDATNLRDIAGNRRDWTALGTVITAAGPTPAITGAVL